jgi:hypothetical protein
MRCRNIFLVASALLLATACTFNPKVDPRQLDCKDDNGCPSGYRCVGVTVEKSGFCCNKPDESACYAPPDAASAVGDARPTDVLSEGIDGTADHGKDVAVSELGGGDGAGGIGGVVGASGSGGRGGSDGGGYGAGGSADASVDAPPDVPVANSEAGSADSSSESMDAAPDHAKEGDAPELGSGDSTGGSGGIFGAGGSGGAGGSSGAGGGGGVAVGGSGGGGGVAVGGSGGGGGAGGGAGGAAGLGGSKLDAALDVPQASPDAGCTPETDAQMCARLGKNCNAISESDNCGQPRSIPSCGECTGAEVCGATVANVCGALPQCVFNQSLFDQQCVFGQ